MKVNSACKTILNEVLKSSYCTYLDSKDVEKGCPSKFYIKLKGSKGKRQWPINRCTSPIIIHKITPAVNYN